MDFQRVLVTDGLAREIFGSAAREQLLFTNSPREQPFRRRPEAAALRALSLIVRFDHLVIHDFGEGTFRLPDLEREGIVEVLPDDWKPGELMRLPTQGARGE